MAKNTLGKSPALLFCNPANPSIRRNLTVRLSRDDGRTWPVARTLCPGPSAYSCLAALPNGSLNCLYECGTSGPYETITFARFNVEWFKER